LTLFPRFTIVERDVAMPAVDPIERQIRQVRRRRNLHELLRGVLLVIATATGSAAALVLLALAADERLFAVATWTLVGAVAATGLLLAREIARRWVSRAGAAAWIDARARLRGRLTTLIAVRAAEARASMHGSKVRASIHGSEAGAALHSPGTSAGAAPAFLPLLTADNVARLAEWRPRLMVRRAVPVAALAAAIAMAAMLLLTTVLAPHLRPSFPEIVYSDEPVDALAGDDADGNDTVPDRVVVTPTRGEASRRSGRRDEMPVAGDGGTAEDDSALARLSTELQDRIRRQLWGREWERARDAMARAERDAARAATARAAGGRGGDSDDDRGEAGDEWETAGLESSRPGGRRPSGLGGSRSGEPTEASDDEAAARGFGDDADTTTTRAGSGEPAQGAGNEADPNVFGAATDVDPHGSDTFELAISAPVRAQRAGPRRAHGEPPPAGDDTHPELARAARAEHAIRRMPIPPAYEAIVREVFAHHEGAAETTP
jgi:hypothetical protein